MKKERFGGIIRSASNHKDKHTADQQNLYAKVFKLFVKKVSNCLNRSFW